MKHVSRTWLFAPVAFAAILATVPALAQTGRVSKPNLWMPSPSSSGVTPETSNTSSPTNWRLTAGKTFNGIPGAFDGTALLLFTSSELSGTYACSGSLVAPQWVLTAGHCTDGLLTMTVQFGFTNNVALVTRNVVSYVQSPGWNGTLDTGADLALVKLDSPVTTLPIYALSSTNDIGKRYVMTGYGTTGTGSSAGSPNWSDSAYGHYGYNTFDVTSDVFEAAWDATTGEGVYTAPTYGHTYVTDFDFYNGTPAQSVQYNTLQRIASATGGTWGNSRALGKFESLIAGGDSGGGDFIWQDGAWVLSAVHSWGWNFCPGRIAPGGLIDAPTCDYKSNNSSSYGDLSGSTAVYEHLDWINSVISAK